MNKDKLIKIFKTGSEIAGGVVSGAIGLIGGPAGAMIGGGAGVVVSKGLIEFTERFLSNRESMRAVASAAYSIITINDRMEKGEILRNDGFFDEKHSRSQAQELFEGVLIKCKNEYQEKKIKYVSNIYSNAVFDSTLSSENANQILNVAEGLSYRKMCIMSLLIVKEEDSKIVLRGSDYRDPYDTSKSAEKMTLELELLLQDFMDLYNAGLVERADGTAMISIFDTIPIEMQLTKIGNRHSELMGLKEIEKQDYKEIIKNLT